MGYGNKFRSEAYVVKDEYGSHTTRFLVLAQDAFGTSLLDVRIYSSCTMQTYLALRTTEADAFEKMRNFIERSEKEGLKITRQSPSYPDLLGNGEFAGAQELAQHPSVLAAERQRQIKKAGNRKPLTI